MIKWYHILITLAVGVAIGYFLPHGEEIYIIDPQIHRLNAEIGWRQLKENRIKDTLKFERQEKMTLAKENVELRIVANKAIDRYKAVSKAIPLTSKDTIVFLMRDTVACDSALQRSQDLVQGLTKEVINDNKEIKHLDSLNIDLQTDKEQLHQADSLNHIDKKQLRKEARRKARRAFFKGAGIGGAIVVILVAIF